MTELVRIKTGNFDIKNSIKLYDYLKLDYEAMLDKILSIEQYYGDFKKLALTEVEFKKFLNGVKIPVQLKDGIVRVYFNSYFKGLGNVENKMLKRYIVE